MIKTKVGIAELKANLSKYLRAAQQGREIIVKDRDTPIVRISALEKEPPLISRLPTISLEEVDRMFEKFHAEHPELADIKDEDVEEALRWTKMDWIVKGSVLARSSLYFSPPRHQGHQENMAVAYLSPMNLHLGVLRGAATIKSHFRSQGVVPIG